MVNTLTAEASLIVGPLVLETLVKHYFDRIKRDSTKKQPTQLRRDELLYDQAFAIIKVRTSQFGPQYVLILSKALPRGINLVSVTCTNVNGVSYIWA